MTYLTKSLLTSERQRSLLNTSSIQSTTSSTFLFQAPPRHALPKITGMVEQGGAILPSALSQHGALSWTFFVYRHKDVCIQMHAVRGMGTSTLMENHVHVHFTSVTIHMHKHNCIGGCHSQVSTQAHAVRYTQAHSILACPLKSLRHFMCHLLKTSPMELTEAAGPAWSPHFTEGTSSPGRDKVSTMSMVQSKMDGQQLPSSQHTPAASQSLNTALGFSLLLLPIDSLYVKVTKNYFRC